MEATGEAGGEGGGGSVNYAVGDGRICGVYKNARNCAVGGCTILDSLICVIGQTVTGQLFSQSPTAKLIPLWREGNEFSLQYLGYQIFDLPAKIDAMK